MEIHFGKDKKTPPEKEQGLKITKALARDLKRMKADMIAEGSFTEESADRIIRLITLRSTPEEKARWIETRVMTEDGKIRMSDEQMEMSFTTFCLWDLVYEKKIEYFPDGKEKKP